MTNKQKLKLRHRLRQKCVELKEDLSNDDQQYEGTIQLDFVGTKPVIDLYVTITRDEFEHEVCAPLRDRLLRPVEDALADAHTSEAEITEVIIVGGSTRIPYVKDMLREYFTSALFEKVNKDTGVAHGAALYAAKVNSNLTEKFSGAL